VQDRRHIANLTVVYSTPKFSGAAARAAASGWTLSSSFQARSGAPVNGSHRHNAGSRNRVRRQQSGTLRPNQVLSDVTAPNQGQSCSISQICVQWLNKNAFAAPSRWNLWKPGCELHSRSGFWQWDAAVSRQFRVTEGSHIELRFEGFNLTNSLRLGLPNNNGGLTMKLKHVWRGDDGRDATDGPDERFGHQRPARVMQFALKYVF